MFYYRKKVENSQLKDGTTWSKPTQGYKPLQTSFVKYLE